MNKDEVKKVYEVLKTADGGCSTCVQRIIGVFVQSFPEHKEEVKSLLRLESDYPIEDGNEWADEL